MTKLKSRPLQRTIECDDGREFVVRLYPGGGMDARFKHGRKNTWVRIDIIGELEKAKTFGTQNPGNSQHHPDQFELPMPGLPPASRPPDPDAVPAQPETQSSETPQP